jgi:hypothetical protein
MFSIRHRVRQEWFMKNAVFEEDYRTIRTAAIALEKKIKFAGSLLMFSARMG